MISSFGKLSPQIAESAFIAGSAEIIGDTSIGDNSSVWHGTVIRADINSIKIGQQTNIQDLCVIHVSANNGVSIADGVTVGHRVILHACTIASNCLIGMGSIILDGVELPEFSFVGAGSVVTSSRAYESGWLILGSPAKAVRKLTSDEKSMILESARKYCDLSKEYTEESNS